MTDTAADRGQLTIGEVAERAGMRTSRIRYYESLGVLPEPARVSGQRRYSPDAVRQLSTIDIAQQVGFTLDEIRDLLNPQHGPAHRRLQRLAERKLPDIDELIQRATAVKAWLEMTRACDCDSLDVCSLFDERVVSLQRHRPIDADAAVIALPSS